MGVLAFFVYKKLAQRSGNWERICGCFKKQQAVEAEEPVALEITPKKRMVTAAWILAVLLGTAFMIYYEILLRTNL